MERPDVGTPGWAEYAGAAEYEEIRLRDQLGRLRPFMGTVLRLPDGSPVHYSTYERGKVRWVEMTVYEHHDGGYVLHRLGKSLVFHSYEHEPRSRCKKVPTWREISFRQLPDNAVPCRDCLPPDELEEGTASFYWAEQDRPMLDRCPQPVDLIRVLTERRPGSRVEYLSEPAQEILALAAKADEAIHSVYHDREEPI